jgi:serine/threonine protein kinase/WD40 repeat protein
MNEAHSPPDSKEQVFGQFFADLDETANKTDVVRRYASAYPQWAREFHAEAALGDVLASTQRPLDEPCPELPDFRMVRVIDRGGMGTVYEAEQLSLKRRVAVKVRRGELSPVKQARFLREQEVLARLHQTHIVPINTAGQVGQWQYLAMAYIEGATLHRLLRSVSNQETTRFGDRTPTLAQLAQEERNRQPSDQRTGDASPRAPAKITLSRPYFRSVAGVIMEAAEALQHAHTAGIFHRDVKPSNIMVDTNGECWLIDFGLALAEAHTADATTPLEQIGHGGALTQGPMGTPEYMAPEQYQAKADARSDVWGLGVTLYELLTLRPAFAGDAPGQVREKVVGQEPAVPAAAVTNVPPDLSAICRKAISKEPEKRYQTAGDLAEDLRRWLHDEPTRARPATVLRKIWLWARRNRGWAAAVVAVVGAVLVTGAYLVESLNTAQELAQQRQQEKLLMEFEQRRLGAHSAGWFNDLHERATKIMELRKGNKSEALRDRYAAALAGIDARRLPGLDTEASSVAFSPDGKRLVIGGYTDFQGVAREPAKVWKGGLDEPVRSTQLGSGPVAFRATDGAALQFVPDTKDWFTLRLWNIDKQEKVGEFKLATKPSAPGWYQANSLTMALCPDGSLVAASTTGILDGKGKLVVWDVKTGKVIRSAERGFTALSFGPDGSLLAAGDKDGKVTIWSRAHKEQRTVLSVGQTEVLAIAFARSAKRGPRIALDDAWLLAVGDSGANVSIWDLQTKTQRPPCRGSRHQVHALAFRPDGTILASAGRFEARLWDTATGQLQLNVAASPERNWITGLAYSLDGSRLAITSATVFGRHRGGVDVWALEYGRGIQTVLPTVLLRLAYPRTIV